MFKMILGVGFIIGGILLEIAWLGVCFGTIIVGLVLLIFAPGILLVPFNFGLASGVVLLTSCEE
jgi:hypothetical protein